MLELCILVDKISFLIDVKATPLSVSLRIPRRIHKDGKKIGVFYEEDSFWNLRSLDLGFLRAFCPER
jgi:hypothetical protein